MGARARMAAALAAVLSFLAFAGCSPGGADNAAAIAAIEAGRGGEEVVVEGVVTRVKRTTSGPEGAHERFDIRITSGAAEQDIAVADNITVGEPAPVHRGDRVVVKGVLEVDPAGPVIHWTHHDPRMRHPSGYVEVGGRIYD